LSLISNFYPITVKLTGSDNQVKVSLFTDSAQWLSNSQHGVVTCATVFGYGRQSGSLFSERSL